MSENIELKDALPQAEENKTDNTATTPDNESDFFVPVKFNKQVLNLDLDKARELAQKGMKFDVISKDYEALRSLARADGKSVSEYILSLQDRNKANRQNEILEKCGGDTSFADYVLELEKGKNEEINGFSELREAFPKIKRVEDLPESVVEAAKMKGTLLLDEYLRYLHKQDTAMKSSIKAQLKAEQSAMGSLLNKKGNETPETAEFLKGLWQK